MEPKRAECEVKAVKLTRVERWILANQYRILEVLQPDDAGHFRHAREALESGYELEYASIAENVYDDPHILSIGDCTEVLDTLAMYESLQQAYDELTDKSGIEEHQVRFPGFDGNNESTRIGYCRHFCERGDDRRYESLRRPADWNSHMPSVDGYRRMLEVWYPMRDRMLQQLSDESLTKAEILEVLLTRAHPESATGRLVRAKPEGPVQ